MKICYRIAKVKLLWQINSKNFHNCKSSSKIIKDEVEYKNAKKSKE